MEEQIVQAVEGTIVSLYPFDVKDEFKPGLIPCYFTMIAGDPVTEKLGITHIRSVKRRMDLPKDRGGIQKVPLLASQLCESLITDYIRGVIEVDEDAKPALFWVSGIQFEEDIKSKYKDLIAQALEKQKNWFIRLVREGDNAWAISKNHRAISTIQKYAAQFLKLDREWMTETEVAQSLSICPLCTAKVSPNAIVCPNCKAVLKQKQYDEYLKQIKAG